MSLIRVPFSKVLTWRLKMFRVPAKEQSLVQKPCKIENKASNAFQLQKQSSKSTTPSWHACCLRLKWIRAVLMNKNGPHHFIQMSACSSSNENKNRKSWFNDLHKINEGNKVNCPLTELLLLGVVSDHKGQSQDQEGYEKLQNLDQKLRSLVWIVLGLLWWSVSAFCRNRWRVYLTDVILVHHLSSRITMAHIFKVICCIFSWKRPTKFTRETWISSLNYH